MDSQKPNGTGDVEDHLPLPGFRFHPTDEELVGFYLRRKVDKKQSSIELIKQVDIYKYDPWDLPKVSTVIGEKEWYFFCMRGRKYRNSFRPNRVTGSGFWKATGIDRPVYDSQQKQECVIGLKKSLVYYVGSAGKGTKTDWMMHEFRLPPPSSSPSSHKNITNLHRNLQEAETWTICRIFKRNSTYKRYGHEFRSSEHSNVKESSTDCSLVTFRTANSVTQDQNSGSAGGFYDGNKFEKKPLLLAAQFDEERLMPTYSGQTPVIELTSPVAIRANLAGEFTNDGTWDEIPSIFELSDPWIMNGCIYS